MAIPNPLEWYRAFYLYYHSVMATRLRGDVVNSHLELFYKKGQLLKSFFREYTSIEYIAAITAQHEKLCLELVDMLTKEFEMALDASPYYLYEYLIFSASNIKDAEVRNYEQFRADGEFKLKTFLQQRGYFSGPSVVGYVAGFNFSRTLGILSQLELIEPITEKSFLRDYVQINHARLAFKGSKIGLSFLYLDPNSPRFPSFLVCAKDENGLMDIFLGKTQENIGAFFGDLKIENNYWAVYPNGKKPILETFSREMSFIDYLQNEIILKDKTKRNALFGELLQNQPNILLKYASLTSQIDALGYSILASLTLLDYKLKDKAEFSYNAHGSKKVDNTMKPFKSQLSFSRDIFNLLFNLATGDYYNSFNGASEAQPIENFKKTYSYNLMRAPLKTELGNDGYAVCDYIRANAKDYVKNNALEINKKAATSKDSINYNLSKVLNEINAYFTAVNYKSPPKNL